MIIGGRISIFPSRSAVIIGNFKETFGTSKYWQKSLNTLRPLTLSISHFGSYYRSTQMVVIGTTLNYIVNMVLLNR
jgi:hypothetical protein